MEAMNKPHRQQQSPFMRLPTEIRLAIYEFALHQFVDQIVKLKPNREILGGECCIVRGAAFMTNPCYQDHKRTYDGTRVPVKGPPFLGPLAFLHTSSIVRAESAGVMLTFIDGPYEALNAELEIAENACEFWQNDEEGTTKHYQLLDTVNHFWKLSKVKGTLMEAVRSVEWSQRPPCLLRKARPLEN